MTGLIYCIENKKSGKKYVGQTTDLTERIRCHKKAARRGRKGIDTAINKYGWENFEVTIFEDNISAEDLTDRERYWIDRYDTYKGKGYNLSPGGDVLRGTDNGMYGKEPANKGTTLSEEEKQKISEWTKGTVPTGSEHPFADLTVEEARDILRARINDDLSMHKLAKKFDRSAFVVNKIISGEHWTIEEGNLEELANKAKGDLRQKVTKALCKKIIECRDKGLTYQKIREKLNIELSKNTFTKITSGRHSLSPVVE